MREQDITDPIAVISFKIAWYQRIASYLVDHYDCDALSSLFEAVRTKELMPTEIAVKFLPVLGAEHSLYRGVIGHFICKSMLMRLGIFDDLFRPAPKKQEMGKIEDVALFYHTDTREYEVSDGTVGVRFPALYVPIFGIDCADEETAVEIAMGILGSRRAISHRSELSVRFPFLKLGSRLPLNNYLKNSAKFHSKK